MYYRYEQEKILRHIEYKKEKMVKTLANRYVEFYTFAGFHRLDLEILICSNQMKESISLFSVYQELESSYIIEKTLIDLLGQPMAHIVIDNRWLDNYIKFIDKERKLINISKKHEIDSLSKNAEEIYIMNYKM